MKRHFRGAACAMFISTLAWAVPVGAEQPSQRVSGFGDLSTTGETSVALTDSESTLAVVDLHGPEVELPRERSELSRWQTLSVANPSVTASGASRADRYGEGEASAVDLVSGVITDREDPRSLASTALLDIVKRRGHHELEFVAQGNYARAPFGDRSVGTAVGNIHTTARHERRLTRHWSAITTVRGYHDTIAELDLRMNLSPGLGYYLVRTRENRFWLEAGYDFELLAAKNATREVSHGYRTRLAYEHSLNQAFGARCAAELRQSGWGSDDFRAQADLALKFQMTTTSNLAAVAIVRRDDLGNERGQRFESVSALRIEHSL